jgi:hypothetical protein
MPLNDALLNSLGGPTSTSAAPSIPTKVHTVILALHYISDRAALLQILQYLTYYHA